MKKKISASEPYVVKSDMTVFRFYQCHFRASRVSLVIKNLLASAGDIRDTGSIHGSERFPEEGHGNAFQYSWRGESHRGAWWATIHGVTESQIRLRRLSAHTHTVFSGLRIVTLQSIIKQGCADDNISILQIMVEIILLSGIFLFIFLRPR